MPYLPDLRFGARLPSPLQSIGGNRWQSLANSVAIRFDKLRSFLLGLLRRDDTGSNCVNVQVRNYCCPSFVLDFFVSQLLFVCSEGHDFERAVCVFSMAVSL